MTGFPVPKLGASSAGGRIRGNEDNLISSGRRAASSQLWKQGTLVFLLHCLLNPRKSVPGVTRVLMTIPSREDMMLSLQDLAERGVDWEWQSRNRSCWLLDVSLARDCQAWDFLSLAFTSDLASQHRDHWPSDRYWVSLSCGHWWRSPNWFSCLFFFSAPPPQHCTNNRSQNWVQSPSHLVNWLHGTHSMLKTLLYGMNILNRQIPNQKCSITKNSLDEDTTAQTGSSTPDFMWQEAIKTMEYQKEKIYYKIIISLHEFHIYNLLVSQVS